MGEAMKVREEPQGVEVLGFRKVPIHRLNMEGNFRERLNHPRIEERARSVKRLGILSEPMVRQLDYRVIYGHDRIAAAIKAGATSVLCKMVRCSDTVMREIELSENLHRRHDPESARDGLLRLMDLYTESVIEERPLPGDDPYPQLTKPKRGKPQTARGIARRRLAADLGVAPPTLQKREQRLRKRKRQKEEQAAREEGKAVIALLGMQVHREFVAQINELRLTMDQAVAHAHRMLSLFSTIETRKLPYPGIKFTRLYEDLRAAGALLRSARPVSLCPYCKGLPGVQDRCAACLQSGWISELQMQSVPSELWVEGERAVVANAGRYEPVAKHIPREVEEVEVSV